MNGPPAKVNFPVCGVGGGGTEVINLWNGLSYVSCAKLTEKVNDQAVTGTGSLCGKLVLSAIPEPTGRFFQTGGAPAGSR